MSNVVYKKIPKQEEQSVRSLISTVLEDKIK